MPVHVARRGKKYRIVDHAGNVEMTPQGHPRDGGGHSTKDMADRQARAINMHLAEKALAATTSAVVKAGQAVAEAKGILLRAVRYPR